MRAPRKIRLSEANGISFSSRSASTSQSVVIDGVLGKDIWFFENLPTKSQLQKYTPNVVVAQPHLRPFLEKGLITCLLGAEYVQQNDYLYHRGSGLDVPTAKFLAKYDVVLCVDLAALSALPALRQSRVLGRVQQNDRLGKKFGFSVVPVHLEK